MRYKILINSEFMHENVRYGMGLRVRVEFE